MSSPNSSFSEVFASRRKSRPFRTQAPNWAAN